MSSWDNALCSASMWNLSLPSLPSQLFPRIAPSVPIEDDLSGTRGQRGICLTGLNLGFSESQADLQPRHAWGTQHHGIHADGCAESNTSDLNCLFSILLT
jgi:hypothetical protein